ncbi:hypothetical protein DDZ13_12240 [Coraliomargarita sinensis]|uniref:Uncharacterized protein n=1 Tax=Coraliomargarita sinensis TaxID=2174842 RepID=A0A317ZDX0_9BACT|nr:hypothetical protein [Coraliomargarita sinensis]PXA03456.1 hypothetical protein DDZ13_12240 [Coraliomargarita sinensis]
MGLSIHYSGTIDRTEAIPKFVEELSDIADSMDWMVQPINEDESDPNFRGIIVNPKGDCEPLCFIFDREGRLRPLMDLLNEQVEPTRYSLATSTKTQFAEIETHVWIIGLLRYLKKRYLSNLKVSDEGEYWETEDLEKLREKKQFLQGMIEQIGGALSEAEPLPEDASVDEMIARIEAIVKELPRDTE